MLNIYDETTRRYKSSRSQIIFKIGALKNLANFTGKHLRWGGGPSKT